MFECSTEAAFFLKQITKPKGTFEADDRPQLWKSTTHFLELRMSDKLGANDFDYHKLCERALAGFGISATGRSGDDEKLLIDALARKLENSQTFAAAAPKLRQMLSDVDAKGRTSLSSAFAAGGLFGLLNAGGFGTFIGLSTLLGGVSSALGITLPFSVYMGSSSMLAIALGPFGLIAAALFGLPAVFLMRDKWRLQISLMVLWVAFANAERQLALSSDRNLPPKS